MMLRRRRWFVFLNHPDPSRWIIAIFMWCLIFSELVLELSNWSRVVIIEGFVDNHCRGILTLESFIFLTATRDHLARLLLISVFLCKLLMQDITDHLFIYILWFPTGTMEVIRLLRGLFIFFLVDARFKLRVALAVRWVNLGSIKSDSFRCSTLWRVTLLLFCIRTAINTSCKAAN